MEKRLADVYSKNVISHNYNKSNLWLSYLKNNTEML